MFPVHRIADALREQIRDGRLQPGAQLPSENQLADTHNASRPTVRRAIAMLRSEGLVLSKQGKGIFVRESPRVRLEVSGQNYRRHQAAGQSGFNAQVREQGLKPEQRLMNVATIPAPPEIANRLALQDDAEVVVRERLFLADSVPVAQCTSYYPADFAAGTLIAEARKVKGGVYALIEDPQGPIARVIVRSEEDLEARMPTKQEAELLKLAPGIPVVRVIRTIYDSGDRPLEVQDSVVAADRHVFRYEVQMR